MKKTKGALFGIIIIALGIVWILKATDIINFSVFFDGWWTLFIIIPSAIGLFTDKNKTGPVIGLLIGILLLVNTYYDIWKYKNFILPALVIIAGITIIISTFTNDKNDEYNNNETDVQPIQTSEAGQKYYTSFSEQNYTFEDNFAGGTFFATFGEITIDLRKANITPNCVITANATFGDIKIIVPDNVRVISKAKSFFGESKNKPGKNYSDDNLTIFLNSANLFGETEII